jgi:FtsH-binding integral membrane protein
MIDINNYLIGFITILIISVILIYIINKKAYDKNGNLQCDNYVLNTYLYILLSFILMGLSTLFYIYTNFFNKLISFLKSSGIFIIIFVVILYIVLIIGSTILINKLDPIKQGFLLHLVWFILQILISIVFSITIIVGIKNNTLLTAILLLVLITLITGYIGYNYGNNLLPVNFDKYLYGSLIILVVVQFLSVFLVRDKKTINKLIYVFAVISLIIFVLLMLSYNNKIRKNAEECNINNNPPNYPMEAYGLVLKMINVLQDLIILLGRKKK